MPWVLRLLSPPRPTRCEPHYRVAGLSLPLRLALSAQAGGATCIEVPPEASACLNYLKDPRLTTAVRTEGQQEAPTLVIEAPWNLVIHRDLLKAIAASRAQGTVRLPEGAVALPTPFAFDPIEVVDRPSAKSAEQMLLRSLRKVQDGWTSTYLNRWISLALTRWLVKTPLHPNQVSVGILFIGILGAVLASRGDYWLVVLGAFLFQTQSVLDGCDGEMSRVTYRGSHLGEWLDTVGDDLTNYGFFAGSAWGLYVSRGAPIYLVAGIVVVTCGLVTSAIEYRYLLRIGSGDLLKYPLGIGAAPSSHAGDGAKGPLGRALDAVSPLFKRDTFVFLTFLGAIMGLLGPFLLMFAAAGIGILVAVVRAELRMAKERKLARLSP